VAGYWLIPGAGKKNRGGDVSLWFFRGGGWPETQPRKRHRGQDFKTSSAARLSGFNEELPGISGCGKKVGGVNWRDTHAKYLYSDVEKKRVRFGSVPGEGETAGGEKNDVVWGVFHREG